MSIVINGVTCEVISRDYREGIDGRGPSATRGYLCDWASRYRVANGLLGLTTFSGSGPAGNIGLPRPGQLPESPNIWATSIRIEGKGQPVENGFGLGYGSAIVWSEYTVPEYGVLGEAQIDPATSFVYATQELDSSEMYVSIPGQALVYIDGTPSNVDRSVIVSVINMTITLHQMPFMPMPALAYAGQLNDDVFLGIDRGKVKFDGARVTRDYSSAGDALQKAAFRFSYRPVADWNKVPDPKGTGTWVLLGYKGAPVYQYSYFNMMTVLPAYYLG
jgi:hypothetical protein